MGFEDHLRRGLSQEAEIMEKVDADHGERFEAMAQLRDKAVESITSLQWTQEQFTSFPSILVLLYTEAIGLFDLIRISLEHGYGRRSRNLIRSLVDIEIDMALLSTGDEKLLGRYGAYEAWELAITGAAGVEGILDETTVEEGVQIRIQSLVERLEALGIDVPEGFSDLGLRMAAEAFSKKIFGRKYPSHWRFPLRRSEWLDIAVDQLTSALGPMIHESDPEQDRTRWELEFAYMWCSEAVHVSPRAIAKSTVWDDSGNLKGIIVAGHIDEIPASIQMAAMHFVRLVRLVGHHTDIPIDGDEWGPLYEALTK